MSYWVCDDEQPHDEHKVHRGAWGVWTCNGRGVDKLSSPAPALSGGTPEGGATGPVPVKPFSVEGKDGHDPTTCSGEPYLPGGAQTAATGAGAIAVPPVPVAASDPTDPDVNHLAEIITQAHMKGINAGAWTLARWILDAGYRRYVLDAPAILDLVERYGYACAAGLGDAAEELLDAIRAALTPVPTVEPDPFNAEETAAAAARRFAGELERLMAGLRDRGILPAPDAPVGTAAVDTALMAIDDLLAEPDEDPRHVIEFREDGWTIKHPLSCRPNLFDCPVNRAAERDLTEPPAALGRFECSTNDLGDRLLIGDRVPVVADEEWAKAIAPLVERNPEPCCEGAVKLGDRYHTIECVRRGVAARGDLEGGPETPADSRPREAVGRPAAAGDGEADPVPMTPGAGSAEPKPWALDAGICRCGADGNGPGDNRCICRRSS